jgi:hypothetical protein
VEPAAEVRAAVGGQLETSGHGILDLGWRRGGASVQVFTDTLDLRYARDGAHGRATVGARVAAAAAGLWITPWTDGAPDPSRAQLAGYAGPDVRIERWGPHGLYGAVEAFARGCWFVPLPSSVLDVPDTWWGHAALVGGYWDDRGRAARISAAFDATRARVAPQVTLEATLRPAGAVAPIGEIRVGWAANQDDVLATRLGGMTPYEVPLAGAAWAEFWVEDYAATRLGAQVRAGDLEPYAVVDAAVWDYPAATTLPNPPARQGGVGGALGTRWTPDPVRLDVSVGWSPDLPRRDGASPWSVFLLAGVDWRGIHR